jgi:hypothetical protein
MWRWLQWKRLKGSRLAVVRTSLRVVLPLWVMFALGKVNGELFGEYRYGLVLRLLIVGRHKQQIAEEWLVAMTDPFIALYLS